MALLIPAIQQSVLFLPLCLGIYLTYQVMQITDLTVEATFVTGAGVFAHIMLSTHTVALAIFLALIIGAIVGLVVAVMQKVTKLDALIISVLAIFMMYSINMMLMGRPNLSLLSVNDGVFQMVKHQPFAFWSSLVLLMALLLVAVQCLLRSRSGLLMRAFGDNRSLLKQLRVNDTVMLVIGMMISNALAAFSGVLTAVVNGYADINLSAGVALTAIGAVIIGLTTIKTLKKSRYYRPGLELLGCVLGVLVYFLLLNGLLVIGVNPLYMKCVLGVMLLVFLSMRQFAMSQEAICQRN